MPRRRSSAAADLELRVIELRADRLSFRAIAGELGLSHQRVHQVWTRACDRLPAQRLDALRAEETELVDTAIRELLEIARQPTVGARTKVETWSCIRGWSERKAKLLGLDAPTRMEVEEVQILDEQVAIAFRAMDAAMKRAKLSDEQYQRVAHELAIELDSIDEAI